MQRGGRPHDRRGCPRLCDPLDDLLDVAGQAPQRGDRLAEPDDEDDRRLHRQLGMDVVGAAQLVGDLIARAAGPAHVEDHPQRVIACHPHAADERRVDQRDAIDRPQLGTLHLDRLQRLVQQLLTMQDELTTSAVKREDQERGRARRAQQADGAAHRARVDAAAVADVEPSRSA